jgi:hypothetical protein
MKNSAVFVAGVLALFLAGCATPEAPVAKAGSPVGDQDNPCSPRSGPCMIAVNVDANCTVTVPQTNYHITGRGPVVLQWNLNGPSGYSFPDAAIKFNDNSNDFDDLRCRGQTCTMRDKNPAPSCSKYSVTVNKPGGGTCPVLDPIIINDSGLPGGKAACPALVPAR